MFNKLLKYDLIAVFKYWWIAALSSVGLSVIAGVCIKIISEGLSKVALINLFSILGLIFSIFGIIAFPILSVILILVRIYKNFYTDEGYLTFTLPIRKSTLLNSKILMYMIVNFCCGLVLFADVFLILAIGIPKIMFDPSIWSELADNLKDLLEITGIGYSLAIVFEIILLLIFSSLVSILMIMFCLSIGSIIAKKHKILMAVGIYYLSNTILSGVTQFILFEGSYANLFQKVMLLDDSGQKLFIVMVLLAGIGLFAAISSGLHILLNWLLERKLNLD